MWNRPDPFEQLWHVPQEHDWIDLELRQWGRWVQARTRGGASSPMFRMFRSSQARGGYGAPTVQPSPDPSRAMAIELGLRELPDLERNVLRSWYASNTPPHILCRKLGLRPDQLVERLGSARAMIVIVLQRMVKAGAAAKGVTV